MCYCISGLWCRTILPLCLEIFFTGVLLIVVPIKFDAKIYVATPSLPPAITALTTGHLPDHELITHTSVGGLVRPH